MIVHNAIKKVRVGEGGENKRLLGCPEIDFWALIYLQIGDFSFSDSSIVFYEPSPTETVSGKSQFSSRSCIFLPLPVNLASFPFLSALGDADARSCVKMRTYALFFQKKCVRGREDITHHLALEARREMRRWIIGSKYIFCFDTNGTNQRCLEIALSSFSGKCFSAGFKTKYCFV